MRRESLRKPDTSTYTENGNESAGLGVKHLCRTEAFYSETAAVGHR